MEYLEQLLRVWKEFSTGQKLSILSFLGVMVAVMIGVFVWSSRLGFSLLYGNLNGNDLTEVVSLIENRAIPYKINGASVLVPSDKVYALRMELAGQGVPSGGGVGFEIFDQTNFGISDFVQKTNYTRALQGELARTISNLSGVRSARVMVSIPENRLLAEASRVKATASVFVDTGGGKLVEDAVNSIRFLVANSVEGLNIDDVAVVDNHGNVLSEALRGGGVLGGSSSLFRYKQSLEEYYSNKIETMLTKIVGKGNVVAKVSVKVNSQASTIVEEKYDPTGQVVRRQTVTEDNSVKDDAQPKQLTAVTNQEGTGEPGSLHQPVSSSKDVAKKKVIAYEISKSTMETVKNAGELEKISAAVFLAMRTNISEGGKNPVPSPRKEEELTYIKKMIAHAIGVEELNNLESSITLQEVPFTEEIVQTAGLLDFAGPIYEVLSIIKNFSGLGVALIMFLIFIRMIKKYKPSKASVEFLEGPIGGEFANAKNVTPKPTVDLINELIRQKPDNVGVALKNWMQNED